MASWFFIGLCGFVFALGAGRAGWAAFRRSRQSGHLLTDLLLLTGLVPVALFSVHPYLGNNLVGAGDSYHYALQAADAVTQMRHGVMPVFVGQSDYAFNGNIHTLRTAPYFTHLAGLLDLLTGRQFSFVTLQNLTVTLTAVLAAWAAYAACLLVSGGRRLAAGLLAAVYVLSPAIMGPLALHDMFATYMAAPWLILCWAGLAGIWRCENEMAAQFLAAGTLGLCWYAHSPLAAWLTLVWGVGQVVRLLLAGGAPGQWRRSVAAGLLLAGLVAYIFTSVGALGEGAHSAVTHPVFSWESLRQFLRGEFTPFNPFPALPSIQLGWALWGLLLGGGTLALFHRRRDGLMLTGLLVALLPFLIPLPWLSEIMWRCLPDQLVILTNWPIQRLCPLLGSGIVIAFAAALRADGSRPLQPGRWVEALLAAALLWSAAEATAIHRRPDVAKLPPATHEVLLAPENLRLTRYSYAFFERPPAYFTHGWTSPEFESRLLDDNLDPAADNSAAVLAATALPPWIPIDGRLVHDFEGPGDYLLQVAFTDTTSAGEITIRGAGFNRFYTLPHSGGRQAFGSDSASAKTIPLRLTKAGLHQIVLGATLPGISVRIIPFCQDNLPVRVTGLLPYTVRARAVIPGFLETPRVHFAGYRATVSGRPAPVRRSPNGLVMIPVPAGESRVVLTYPGPLGLQAAWFVSLACFAAWPWLQTRATAAPTGADLSWPWIRKNNLGAGLARGWRQRRRAFFVATWAVLLVAAGATAYHLWQVQRAYGSLRLVVELPKQPVSHAEPLLTLGRTGAADCIYVIYEDSRHIRIGLDHWAYGGPLSDPIPVSFAQPQTIEITLGGLYPASTWMHRPSLVTGAEDTGPIRITFNGRLVLTQEGRFYYAAPDEVAVGRNPVGSSVASERFSGRILSSERFIPAPP